MFLPLTGLPKQLEHPTAARPKQTNIFKIFDKIKGVNDFASVIRYDGT